MKITICGSMVFVDQMLEIKSQLKAMGHEIKIPPTEIIDTEGGKLSVKEYHALRHASTNDEQSWVWERKHQAIKDHFDKVIWADAILVLNYPKNNIPGYIGANTFLEIGLAMHHNKKIFLLFPIPDQPIKEELLGIKPFVINQNLELIK